MTQSSDPDRQSSDPDRPVPTRRISFEESLQDLPRHFAADGDLILSHLAAALSAVFPDGEDFFVRSVRRYRDQITDPDLKRQVNGFIGQEAMHGREHRAFNDRLDQLGYPTKRVERFTAKGLALRERLLPPMSNLAATAALEHFTATLAELVLSSEETRALFGHDEVRNLFLWHALEESEHKAVAFDVYRAVGGSERLRVMTMNLHALRVRRRHGRAGRSCRCSAIPTPTGRARCAAAGATSAAHRSCSATCGMQLRDYNRPDFHPDDRDATELIERWRAELFGADGTLNDKLATAATTAA